MGEPEVYVSLDIGSTSVKCIIGEVSDEAVHIIGVGNARSTGIRKGSIVDIDATVQSIKRAVDQAERMIGMSIHKVILGIPAAHVMLQDTKGVVAVVKNDENREKTNEELLYKLDKYFKTNNDCNGCGLCLMVCPVNNIKIINKKPEWQSHCENCTACYNFCPNKAISNRISKNGYRYLMNGYSTVDAKKQCKIV